MVKVSIVVPVYNASSTIERCVNSIIEQTYRDLEIILINDGSKDNSLNILNDLAKKDKRIFVKTQKNCGVAITRNKGIKLATGKYIMFIDNDDYIDNDYVETYLKIIETKKVNVVMGGYRREDNNKLLFSKTISNTPWSKYIIMAPWAKIYDRDYLLHNKIEFYSYPIGEDVYFTMKLIALNAKFYITEYIGYTWYYNDVSVSNTKQKGIKKNIDIFKLLDNINSFFTKKDDLTKYYFYKYMVWYLLFSGRDANKGDFKKQFNLSKEWLIKNDCYKVINPFSKKLIGESFRDRSAVLCFKILDKLHLVGCFANIYCRG